MPSVALRFGLIMEAYCRGSTHHMKVLMKQVRPRPWRCLSGSTPLEPPGRGGGEAKSLPLLASTRRHRHCHRPALPARGRR